MKELKTWKDVVQAMLNNEQVEVFNNELGEWLDVLHFPFFRVPNYWMRLPQNTASNLEQS